ncbi:olfactory receptor 7A10-like [Erethizon dorsatum]
MEQQNDTRISEFLLLGFSEDKELQLLVFGLFLSMYLITLLGNLIIVLATILDSHLHTPMYFFLSNLSFVDISFTSTTVPKMLVNIQTQSKVITYKGCITQIYFFVLFAVLDNFLLAVMAYDRFVAICHPLHYTVIMKPWVCRLLVLVSWTMSVLNSFLQSLMVLRLSFCTHLKIPHFFCELNQLVLLACSDTGLNDMMIYVTAMLLAVGPLSGILYSYSRIVSTICAISSAQGKYKSFSTCASHLSAVSLFYSTTLCVYLSSALTQSSHYSSIASVMYTVVTPMLNPFIYSLRNKDIKNAVKRFFDRNTVSPDRSPALLRESTGTGQYPRNNIQPHTHSLTSPTHFGHTSARLSSHEQSTGLPSQNRDTCWKSELNLTSPGPGGAGGLLPGLLNGWGCAPGAVLLPQAPRVLWAGTFHPLQSASQSHQPLPMEVSLNEVRTPPPIQGCNPNCAGLSARHFLFTEEESESLSESRKGRGDFLSCRVTGVDRWIQGSPGRPGTGAGLGLDSRIHATSSTIAATGGGAGSGSHGVLCTFDDGLRGLPHPRFSFCLCVDTVLKRISLLLRTLG